MFCLIKMIEDSFCQFFKIYKKIDKKGKGYWCFKVLVCLKKEKLKIIQ